MSATLGEGGPSGPCRDDDRARALLTLDLRPIRYLHDLLERASERARRPVLASIAERGVRTAAGIERAELDACMARARSDATGRVGIPFLDVIFTELVARSAALLDGCDPAGAAPFASSARTAHEEIVDLGRELVAPRDRGPSASEPITFLSEVQYRKLCGPDSVVARMLAALQEARATALAALRS